MSKSALDSQVRKLLQFIVYSLPDTEPDWVDDKSTVVGRIYSEAVHLLHAEANSIYEEIEE